MAEFVLFTNPMSRGQIARWALHEARAEYETQLVDWEDKPDALLAVNPMGKVPTLVHNHNGHQHVVTECAAICHYLAAMHAPELAPRAEEMADYFRYFFFAAGPLEQAIVANSMGWTVPFDKQMTAGFGTYERTIDTLETLMSDRDYVCGDRFTMADVYVGSHITWGMDFGSIPKRGAFEEYAARLRKRSAYNKARAIDMKLIAEAQADD
ncbi:glutathione S-transferase family protein [Qipengyuania sp.]|uniref:glutathione S-transferase family protein n=1 Tax=Qipengyuania sp. TaxID=2004515 RepID=UPI003517767E